MPFWLFDGRFIAELKAQCRILAEEGAPIFFAAVVSEVAYEVIAVISENKDIQVVCFAVLAVCIHVVGSFLSISLLSSAYHDLVLRLITELGAFCWKDLAIALIVISYPIHLSSVFASVLISVTWSCVIIVVVHMVGRYFRIDDMSCIFLVDYQVDSLALSIAITINLALQTAITGERIELEGREEEGDEHSETDDTPATSPTYVPDMHAALTGAPSDTEMQIYLALCYSPHDSRVSLSDPPPAGGGAVPPSHRRYTAHGRGGPASTDT